MDKKYSILVTTLFLKYRGFCFCGMGAELVGYNKNKNEYIVIEDGTCVKASRSWVVHRYKITNPNYEPFKDKWPDDNDAKKMSIRRVVLNYDLKKNTSPTEEKLYRITCTREVLMLIANCVEDISRFSSGQTELSKTLMQMLSNGDDSCILRDEAESHLQDVKKVLFPELQSGAFYSYSGGNIKNQIRKNLIGNTYQIYREILHQVALEENWNNVYSSETLPSGNFPKIEIEIINPTK